MGYSSEDALERWRDAVERAEAEWSVWTRPLAREERAAGAPSWWKGEEEAAAITTAGASTLREARTRPR